MSNIAVIYASGMTGNTRRVAEYISRQKSTDIFDLKKMSAIDISGYDTIVFGTGIHAGKPYAPLVDFLNKNKDNLVEKKLYLFICCMYNDDKGDRQCEAVSQKLGISDAVYFNKKGPNMNSEGFPEDVDVFISKL
jgi:menaquinone-dependent protoporphyrinogen oxidase